MNMGNQKKGWSGFASAGGPRSRGMAMALLVVLMAVAVLLAAVVFLNPFNWLARRSANFTEAAFLSIQKGAALEQVVALLGEPIEVEEISSPISDCKGCKAYCFLGEPPIWVVEFREAWVIVDPEGKVFRTWLYTET